LHLQPAPRVAHIDRAYGSDDLWHELLPGPGHLIHVQSALAISLRLGQLDLPGHLFALPGVYVG
jgi:hypothetical protein